MMLYIVAYSRNGTFVRAEPLVTNSETEVFRMFFGNNDDQGMFPIFRSTCPRLAFEFYKWALFVSEPDRECLSEGEKQFLENIQWKCPKGCRHEDAQLMVQISELVH